MQALLLLTGSPQMSVSKWGHPSGAESGWCARMCCALEPDPAMLTELRRALPAVRALPGSGEAIPLPDRSVDAVLSGGRAGRDATRALSTLGLSGTNPRPAE